MKRETGTALFLAAVIAAPLAAVPAQAQAPNAAERRAPTLTITPASSLIRPDRATWLEVTADFEGPRKFYNGVLVEMKSNRGSGYNYVTLTDPENDGVWKGRVKFDAFNAVPGAWRAESSAIDDDTAADVQGPTTTFSLKFATRLALAVKPKSVRRGGPVKVGGKLQTVGIAGGYTELAGRQVKIYFRPKGKSKWSLAGKAKTDALGRFTRTFRPKKSGAIVLVWSGNAQYAPAKSKPIAVRVG